MTEDQAIARADNLITVLIQHQPGFMPPLQNPSYAEQLAKSLATFRLTLIRELTAQPLASNRSTA